MKRQILTLLLFTSSSFAVLAAACTAHLEEGCLGGACGPINPGTDAGEDADAGLNSCMGMDPPATGDFPCAVFDVIHRRCNPCHTTPVQNGAPFPLLTFEDTQAPYSMAFKVYQIMNIQIRPDSIPRMPQGGDFSDPGLLQDLAILGDWTNACAPPVAEGTGCECPGMGCTP